MSYAPVPPTVPEEQGFYQPPPSSMSGGLSTLVGAVTCIAAIIACILAGLIYGNTQNLHNGYTLNTIDFCPSDFDTSTGLVIQTDGTHYRLVCASSFSPSADGVHAITVNANDVDIDLGMFPLAMDTDSSTYDNHGIYIAPNAQRVRIHDGTIRGFSSCSIAGNMSLNALTFTDLQLSGITADQGGNRLKNEIYAGGICLVCTSDALCSNARVKNVLMQDFTLPNNAPSDTSPRGIEMDYFSNIWIEETRVTNLRTTAPVTSDDTILLGYGFNTVFNLIMRDCHADNGYSVPSTDSLGPTGQASGDAYGFQIFLGSGEIEISDCSANNHFGTRRGGGFVLGFGTSNFIVQDSQATNNTVINVANPGVFSHYGFEAVAYPPAFPGLVTQGQFVNCQVTGMALGFAASGFGSIILFKNCLASGSSVPFPTNVFMGGFQSFTNANIVFEECTAMGFQGYGTLDDSSQSGTGAGFYVGEDSFNVTIKDCVSSQNDVGIQVGAGSTGIVARDNDLYFNDLVGLSDSTPGQTPNLYIGNVAFGNGKVGGKQYAVNTANPNFVEYQTSQSASFPLIARPLTNYDLSP